MCLSCYHILSCSGVGGGGGCCWGYGISRGIEEFVGVIKKNSSGISRVLVLGLKISEGCHTILWSFFEWSLVLSEISTGKVKNLKIPGWLSKKYILKLIATATLTKLSSYIKNKSEIYLATGKTINLAKLNLLGYFYLNYYVKHVFIKEKKITTLEWFISIMFYNVSATDLGIWI